MESRMFHGRHDELEKEETIYQHMCEWRNDTVIVIFLVLGKPLPFIINLFKVSMNERINEWRLQFLQHY